MNQYVDLLRKNRNYRFLWLGSVITQLGDWFNLLASAELITNLTDSGIAVSYLFLARFLPLFFFSPVAGILADRYDRRRVMIMTDVVRAATVVCFLFVRSAEQVWVLYLLTVVQFTLSALFTPARTAVLANVVKRKNLVTANALDSLTWSTMLALGAFLGGLVAAVFGITTAFLADAATFLLSAFILSRIDIPSTAVSPPEGETRQQRRRRGWLALMGGYRYLIGVPFILGVSLAKGGGSLIWGSINVLEVTFADEIFPLLTPFFQDVLRIESGGTATLGIIYVASGLGTGLGPILVRRWLGDTYTRLLWGITGGFFLLSAGIIGLSQSPTLPIFTLFTLTRTVGSGLIWVFSAALLQMMVPDEYRGRVFAFEFAALTLTQSISIFGAGYLMDNLGMGVRRVTAVMGYGGLIVGGIWLIFFLRYFSRAKALQQSGAQKVETPSSISS